MLKAAVDAGGNMVMTEAELREKTALPSSPQQPSEGAAPRSAPMNVEKALALLAEGKDDAVRPHLSALKARLMPLLKLMQEKS